MFSCFKWFALILKEKPFESFQILLMKIICIPRGGKIWLKRVKLMYFCKKNFFCTMWHDSDKQSLNNEYQERVCQNYTFYDPRWKGSRVGARTCKSSTENALFLLKASSILWAMIQANLVHSNKEQVRVYQNCKYHKILGRCVAIKVIQWKCIIPLKILFSASKHRSDKPRVYI